MRWLRCRHAGQIRLLGHRRGSWVDVSAELIQSVSSSPSVPMGALADHPELNAALRRGPDFAGALEAYEPPVADPGKILCVGRNYVDHAREMEAEIPDEPLIFSKLRSALIGHEQSIVLPMASSQVDYEAELVVIMGRAGRDIPEADALEYVAGYMCGNDVSARDWQKGKPGGQWLLGKSFDTFAPTGPEFVTTDEVPDVQDLEISLRLNGTTMQRSNTRCMIFSVARLIAYLSQVCRLEPGDLIFTGTPDGVGAARRPPIFLRAGDVVEVEIERIGLLRNSVTDG